MHFRFYPSWPKCRACFETRQPFRRTERKRRKERNQEDGNGNLSAGKVEATSQAIEFNAGKVSLHNDQ